MDFLHLVFLALVQGITEFLPISSSGHLVLAPMLVGEEDQGKLIDVALHLGSLFAVLIYFWKDVKGAIIGPFYLVSDAAAGRPMRWEGKLAALLVIATIPLVLFGLFLSGAKDPETGEDFIDSLRTIEVIGWTTLIYGVALYIADRFFPQEREIKEWTWAGAVILGVAQMLALIPGTSRSGVTMTAARFLGFTRTEGARISMLMAIPAILAASAKGGLELYETGDLSLTTDAAIGAVLAFISAYLALVVMMRMLRSSSFTPFVVYRMILGAVLLYLAYGA